MGTAVVHGRYDHKWVNRQPCECGDPGPQDVFAFLDRHPEYAEEARAMTDDIQPEDNPELVGDDYINPNAQDGEPEAPDVRTDPVEDDPDADHEAVEED